MSEKELRKEIEDCNLEIVELRRAIRDSQFKLRNCRSQRKRLTDRLFKESHEHY